MPKEKQRKADSENDEREPAANSLDSDDSERRYYYDDAHGYKDFDPEKVEEDEEDD